MFFNQVQTQSKGNASGLKGWACLFGTPWGKGSPKVPSQPLGPNYLLHDGPNEAAAQDNGGHHQQVEVNQVEIQGGMGGRVRGRIPPHCLVDVDVVDEEGYELAEEELQLKQNAGLDWQLRDLAVL